MTKKMDRIASLIFDYETTNRSDYRDINMLQSTEVFEKVEPSRSTKRFSAIRELPKSSNQEEAFRSGLDGKDEVERGLQKRPRLVMAPAVSIDDIDDLRVRQILIEDIYTSTARRSYNQPISNNVRAPLSSRYAPSNPLSLPKLLPPYVAPEWRLESARWDKRQLRAHCESTKQFWNHYAFVFHIMSDRKQVVDSIIFDYKTTTNTDYKGYDVQPYVKTVYKDKTRDSRESKQHLKYIHTMSDWKRAMPFDSMIERKEILRTNPHQIQTSYEKPIDLEKERIRKTRPHLIMTPSVNLDKADDITYALLVKDKYTTHMMRDFGKSCGTSKVRAPLTGKYAPNMPLTLPKYAPPLVVSEWRMESASWDRRQRRDYCDATKVFWLNRNKDTGAQHQRTL